MTTTADRPTAAAKPAYSGNYPTLLRMGHRFEFAIGQRLIVDGLYGGMDLAFAGDGWIYILNRYETNGAYPRVRFAVCNTNDEFPRNVVPTIDGQAQQYGSERYTSPVCCDSDHNGALFFTDEHANKVVLMDTEGDVVDDWGVPGNSLGQLNAPAGIAYARDGTVWTTCSRSHLVQQFTGDGKFIRGFGGSGSEPGRFNYPWGVAIDPVTGDVLVADWRNDRVQRMSPEGEVLQVIADVGHDKGCLTRPSDVTVDAHGDVYICDRGNDRVLQFNPRGLFIESFIGDATMNERGANKLMANPDMLRWRDHIVDLDREKRFWKPTAVKTDADFRVFVLDQGRFRLQVYRKTFRELQPSQVDPPETYNDPKIN
jgi:DNA-binding beta-propeller fold protein YncE